MPAKEEPYFLPSGPSRQGVNATLGISACHYLLEPIVFPRSSNRIHIVLLTLDAGKEKRLVVNMGVARPFALALNTSPIEDHMSSQPFLHLSPVYPSN